MAETTTTPEMPESEVERVEREVERQAARIAELEAGIREHARLAFGMPGHLQPWARALLERKE